MATENHASSTSLHAHGDGSYHTHTPARSCDGHCGTERGSFSMHQSGERKHHKHIGAALMHMARKHSDGDHMHIHGHEDGYTSHHVMEGESVQGPHEHESTSGLKKHVADTMDEE